MNVANAMVWSKFRTMSVYIQNADTSQRNILAKYLKLLENIKTSNFKLVDGEK
jgi:hypothetical protein